MPWDIKKEKAKPIKKSRWDFYIPAFMYEEFKYDPEKKHYMFSEIYDALDGKIK